MMFWRPPQQQQQQQQPLNLISPPLSLNRLQTQMKIMNRNLTGKLEELHGIQHVDTHVALSEIRGQLHELTRRY